MIGKRGRAHTAPERGSTYAEGEIVGYCDAPMVLIVTDSGARVWWRRDLTEVVDAETPQKGRA